MKAELSPPLNHQENEIKGYWTTKDLCKRYSCSRSTIYRWMKKDVKAFPEPKFNPSGSHNLWVINDIETWEDDAAQKNTADIC